MKINKTIILKNQHFMEKTQQYDDYDSSNFGINFMFHV